MTTKTITIGCGEWGFRDLPMRRHFEIAHRFGFRWLEFGIGGGQTGRLSESPDQTEIDTFRALGHEFEIATPFCCIENDFTLKGADEHLSMVDKVLRQVQAAADCGSTHVRLFAGFTPSKEITPDIWSRMIDAFAQVETRCAELDLVIAIETHGAIRFDDSGAAHHVHTVSTDPTQLARLLDELPPRIGINYDPGNLKAVSPNDSECLLPLVRDRVVYCHLKDWTRRGDGWDAVAIGDDSLDYAPLFRGLPFDGVCLIEYEPLHDIEDGIQRSLDYLYGHSTKNPDLAFVR